MWSISANHRHSEKKESQKITVGLRLGQWGAALWRGQAEKAVAWLVRWKAKWPRRISSASVRLSLSHTHTHTHTQPIMQYCLTHLSLGQKKKKNKPHKRARALSLSPSKAVEHEAVAGPIPLPNDIQQDNVVVPLSSVLWGPTCFPWQEATANNITFT